MIDAATHFVALAAAYVRGVLHGAPNAPAPELDDATTIAIGLAGGLRLHRFKRTADMQRVRAAIGTLRGFGAQHLVDIGSGRGAFIWPLLDGLPHLRVIATDVLPHRALMFAHVARGGVDRLASTRADARALPFADDAVDCVTALEVLEHLPGDGPERATREIVRVARTAVIATVPSHEDDNPEHVQLFDGAHLQKLFQAAGARRVTIDHVLNHIVCVAIK